MPKLFKLREDADAASTSLAGRTMLGEKLRRAAARAAVSNPVTARPWLASPAYANNWPQRLGDIVIANGSFYVCVIAGTTAASGTGPTVTANAGLVQDGTAYFAYYGGVRLPDPGDGAPTVTFVTSTPGYGGRWYPVSAPDRYRKRGCNAITSRTNWWLLQAFNSNASTAVCNGASVSAACDNARVAIFVPVGAYVRVLVDDRYLQMGNYSSASDAWVVIDWTASSGRRMRTYEVETNQSSTVNFYGYIETDGTGNVSAPSAYDETRGVWIGDSYQAGSSYGPFLGGGSMSSLVGKLLGIRDMWGMGIGGTGYVSKGTGSAYYSFRERLPQAVALNPNVMFFCGSVNDKSQTAAAITAEVTLTMQAVRALGYTGPLVVVGVPSIDTVASMTPTGTGLTAAQIEAAIFAGVAAVNDAKIFTIPIATDTIPWVTGNWNNSGLPISGTYINKDYYIAADAVHPPEYGTAYYALRVAEAFKARVLGVL